MNKRALKLAFAVLIALALTGEHASATHSGFYSFSVANTSAGANSNATSNATFGSTRPTTMQIIFPPGVLIAHANDATSPISPPPQDNDIVAEGTATARWNLLFCASSTQDLDGEWVEPIDAGAPSGTVAQINMVNALGFTTKTFVKLVNSDSYFNSPHYVIDVPDMPDQYVCSSTTNGATTITTYGVVPGTSRKVAQNPASAGTYTGYGYYTDTTGATHTGSDTVTIT